MAGQKSSEETKGTLHEWLTLVDFGGAPQNVESVWLRIGAFIAGVTAIFYVLRGPTAAIADARPLPRLTPDEHVGFKFGISEENRRAIFEELARAEKAERERAVTHGTWSGHAWSREDDRGNVEMGLVRTLAAKYHVTVSSIYAVLDDGIRERWPGPDGLPLPAQTPPLDPRTW